MVPAVDQRFQELFENDNAGNRITGNADHGFLSACAEDRRFSGLDGNAVVQHSAQRSDHFRGVILAAGGGAGVQQHDIAFCKRCLQGFPDLFLIILYNGISARNRLPAVQHAGENGGVEFQDISGRGIRRGRHDLVPCRNDPDNRLFQDRYFSHACCDHRADRGGRDLRKRRQDHFARADILPDLSDMLPRSSGGVKTHGPVFLSDHIFDHNDSITAFRDRVSGIDNDELISGQRCGRGLAGAEGEPGFQGDAVHSARGVMRCTDRSIDRAGCDPSAGSGHGDGFRSGTETRCQQCCRIIVTRFLKRYICQILKCHSRPPCGCL